MNNLLLLLTVIKNKIRLAHQGNKNPITNIRRRPMNTYSSMYSGLSGQAHACCYRNNASKKQQKSSAFETLENSISEHRSNIEKHYNTFL